MYDFIKLSQATDELNKRLVFMTIKDLLEYRGHSAGVILAFNFDTFIECFIEECYPNLTVINDPDYRIASPRYTAANILLKFRERKKPFKKVYTNHLAKNSDDYWIANDTNEPNIATIVKEINMIENERLTKIKTGISLFEESLK